MAAIRVNAGSQQFFFKATATLDNVLRIIRGRCRLGCGGVEHLEGVLITDADLTAGETYNFVGGIAPGKLHG